MDTMETKGQLLFEMPLGCRFNVAFDKMSNCFEQDLHKPLPFAKSGMLAYQIVSKYKKLRPTW